MEMNIEFWKNKRVLITGHTGFKGSWLSLWLRQVGAIVIGYALDPPTTPSLFKLIQADQEVTSTKGDIRDYKKLLEAIRQHRPEIIIHMAAQPLVRESYANPTETYATNVMGTVHLMEAVCKADCVRAVLNVTTDKCYENREWVWGYRENEPLGGLDPYSSSKACSELVTTAFRSSFHSSNPPNKQETMIASARAGNVIGGGDWAKDRLIPDCIRSWMQKKTVRIRYPEAVRPWQHVLEPLSGYLHLVERLYQEGRRFAEAWNFGPDENDAQSVHYVVKQLASYWGNDAELEIEQDGSLHEAGYLKLDCSKAKHQLGWHPKWNLETAIEKTADWYLTYLKDPQKLRQKTLDQIHEYSIIP